MNILIEKSKLAQTQMLECTCNTEKAATTKCSLGHSSGYSSGYGSEYDCQVFEIIPTARTDWPESLCDVCVTQALRQGELSPIGDEPCPYYTCLHCHTTAASLPDAELPLRVEYRLHVEDWWDWSDIMCRTEIVEMSENDFAGSSEEEIVEEAAETETAPPPKSWHWRNGRILITADHSTREYAWYREPPAWLKNLEYDRYYRLCQLCVAALEPDWITGSHTVPTPENVKGWLRALEVDLYMAERLNLGDTAEKVAYCNDLRKLVLEQRQKLAAAQQWQKVIAELATL